MSALKAHVARVIKPAVIVRFFRFLLRGPLAHDADLPFDVAHGPEPVEGRVRATHGLSNGGCECALNRLAVVERDYRILETLRLLMPFAGDEHQVARMGGVNRFL